MSLLRRLLGYVRPYRAALVFAMLAMAGVAVFNAAFYGILKFILDDLLFPDASRLHFAEFLDRWGLAVPAQWEGKRWLVLAAFVAVAFGKGLFTYLSQFLMARVGNRVAEDVRNGLYASYHGQSLDFFSRRGTGELISHVMNDAAQVQTAVTANLIAILQHLLTIVALLGVMFACDARLSLAVLLAAPPAAWAIYLLGRRIRKYSRRSLERTADLTALLQEVLPAMRVVKVFLMEPHEQARFRALTAQLRRVFVRAAGVQALSSPLMEFAGVLLGVPLIWVGYLKISGGQLTPGDFGAFLAAMFGIYAPLKHISNSNAQLQTGLAAAERLFALQDAPPSVADRPGAAVLENIEPGIAFKNASFQYEGGELPALRGVSLEVRPGETVALVGPSGAGKTTLVHLLPRFYDVSGGRLEIGGRDVREYTLASLRSHMAIVTQETYLFNASAAANIRYGRPSATDAEVEAAARDANAHEFIMEMPRGYASSIGENGRSLSGGQRQRLAIARAILKNPSILILDEATSDLDARSEAAVQEALWRLLKGRTAFVVAHRLATVLHADRIVVMERGVVAAQGRHEELKRTNALYAELCRLQFGGAKAGREPGP